MFINYSCKLENKTNSGIKSSNETSQNTTKIKVDGYLSVFDVDTLPVFKYNDLKRQIQPCLRDSLLSVFLEDSLLRQPIGGEGVFYYELKLYIDNQGDIKKVEFEKDDYNSSQLTKYIVYDLSKIKLIPAKKKGINVPIYMSIGVKLDLYFVPSDFRVKLFPSK